MSTRAEVLRDRNISRKEPLGVARRFEPLQVPLLHAHIRANKLTRPNHCDPGTRQPRATF
jgi:hypothetical protein